MAIAIRTPHPAVASMNKTLRPMDMVLNGN